MNLLNRLVVLFLCLNTLYGCKTEEVGTGGFDGGKSVEFSDYSPKTGAMRTRLFIYGQNFGTDISKIHVSIAEKPLTVIGSDGKQIYCMLPTQVGSGQVKVRIDNGNGTDHVFSDPFVYKATQTVGTLVGSVDEKGNSSIVNGSFDIARFGNPSYILYEPKENNLFVVEAAAAVRKVDLNERTVSTLITNGQAYFSKIQTISLSFNNDTLYLVDDNGKSDKSRVAIAYTLRSENYRRVHPYIYDRTSYNCAQHPVDNVMFFNTYWGGGIQKAYEDPVTKELTSKELFLVTGSGNNVPPNIFFHPSGNYCYFMIQRAIWKSRYNWVTKELETPILFAGQYTNTNDDVDAVGTSARFGYLRQGVFVKNPDYAGQEDEYDFYVCDINNHSIRKVTPRGEVTTFAGKGSPTPDGSKNGYIDGDLLKEARFNKPNGIAYDEERKIFYITEEDNKRVRTIKTE